MRRRDYAFPFRIDSGSRQAAEAAYADHVRQMIVQLLLTSPGERADLPEFGCGLRRLIFAPHSEALDATTQMLVQQALDRWLAGRIQVSRVRVSTPADDAAQIVVDVDYVLLTTQTPDSAAVRIGV